MLLDVPIALLLVLHFSIVFNSVASGHAGNSNALAIDADINQALTEQLGVKGVLVLSVESGSAADAAGLRGTKVDRNGDVIAGDVIVAMNDQAVDSVDTLLGRLDDHRIGDRVILRIWRAGRELDVDVVLQGGS